MHTGIAALRESLVSTAEIRKFVRDVYLSRICLSLLIAIWLFTSVMVPGDRMQAISLPWRALFNAAGAFFFCLVGYLFLPVLLRATLARNIPFVWSNIAFYSLLAGADTIAFKVLFPGSERTGALGYWLTAVVMIAIAVPLVMLFFEEQTRARLSTRPELLPIWRPVRLPESTLEAHLPPEKRAPIRRLEAQNQYVRVVTDCGDTLLRMSLREAEEKLPPDTGMRIHRSIWMSRSQMQDLVFRNGNPKLLDPKGREYPVSRKKVAELRMLLAGRR